MKNGRLLQNYIARQVLKLCGLVLIALMGVDLIFYSINELRFVGQGDYTLWRALEFIALTLPRKVFVLCPWAGLVGTLLGLGLLARGSELVAMRAAAVSLGAISWAVVRAGLIFGCCMFVVGETIAPAGEQLAQRRKVQAMSGGQTLSTQRGIWARQHNRFVHIAEVTTDGHLREVTQYIFNDDLTLAQASVAQRAVPVAEGWRLEGVALTLFEGRGIQTHRIDSTVQANLIDPKWLQSLNIKRLERLSLRELWGILQRHRQAGQNPVPYQRAFWLKAFFPISTIVMMYLAVPFVFGPLRQTSAGLKVVVGILVGFSFHTLNNLFGPLTTVTQLSPFWAAMIPVASFLLLGSLLLRRVR